MTTAPKTSRFLVSGLALGSLLLAGLGLGSAWAARPPDTDKAAYFVEQLLAELSLGPASSERIEQVFEPAGESLHPAERRGWYSHLEQQLGEELGRTLSAQPSVRGVVAGPDYVRVVLDTEPALSTKVVRSGGELHSQGFEPVACSLCSEPEQFLREIFERVQSRRQHRRMVPGADLMLDPAAEHPRDPKGFLLALQNRNVDAGYLRWLLADARVLSADGVELQVAYGETQETWTVVYERGRWMLDYGALAQSSPMRLQSEEVEGWRVGSTIGEHAVQWWLPTLRQTPQGLVLAEDMLFVSPRVQGDVVAYAQTLDRSYALLALLDADSGQVKARFELPTLSKQQNFSQRVWRDLFVFELSPGGKLLALGAWDRMWVIEVDSGRVVATRQGLSALDVLAWSADGSRLLVADHIALMELDPLSLKDIRRRALDRPLVDLSWSFGEIWTVNKRGALRIYSAETLIPVGQDTQACCGQVQACELDPASGELLVSCDTACEPTWLWVWDGQSPPSLLADEQLVGRSAVLSLDPSGRYLVAPSSTLAAGLYDRKLQLQVGSFGSSTALTQAAWSADGAALYGVDSLGVAWRWQLSELTAR